VFQSADREPRGRVVSEAADHQDTARVAGDRPSRGARDHGLGDAGSLWQRPGPGVRRSLRPRLLAAASRQVGPLPQHQRRRGEFLRFSSTSCECTRRPIDTNNNGHVADVTFLPFATQWRNEWEPTHLSCN